MYVWWVAALTLIQCIVINLNCMHLSYNVTLVLYCFKYFSTNRVTNMGFVDIFIVLVELRSILVS